MSMKIFAFQIKPTGFGTMEPTKSVACLTDQERSTIQNKLDRNIQSLKSKGSLKLNVNATVSFDWPMRMINNQQLLEYIMISNYVDHNPTATGTQYGASNLDYNCGNRTYDTNSGYNHKGIDFAVWPFEWYIYSNNLVELVAAEAGTIIGIDDGFDDDHCSCSGDWNAIYIMHADGSKAWYGHMKKNKFTTKTMGQSVAKGEFLGVMASSGCSTGPHLHFEVYDAMNNLIDPFYGACNSTIGSSWWSNQEPYLRPRLNALTTHLAAPVFGCTNLENPNFANCFNAGATVYCAFYYVQQQLGDISNMRLVRPNNSIYTSWMHTAPATYLNGSYWYWSRTLPVGEMKGSWKLEADYRGKTYSYSFAYSDYSCSCPLSWSNSNGNKLSGDQNANAHFESFGLIESNQQINTPWDVIYDSGTTICFDNGFQVNIGANFQAIIDGCGNQ